MSGKEKGDKDLSMCQDREDLLPLKQPKQCVTDEIIWKIDIILTLKQSPTRWRYQDEQLKAIWEKPVAFFT